MRRDLRRSCLRWDRQLETGLRWGTGQSLPTAPTTIHGPPCLHGCRRKLDIVEYRHLHRSLMMSRSLRPMALVGMTSTPPNIVIGTGGTRMPSPAFGGGGAPARGMGGTGGGAAGGGGGGAGTLVIGSGICEP